MEEEEQASNPNHGSGTHRIKLNVGGKLFETTASTLRSGGPDSLLAVLSRRVSADYPIFIDRDPDIFSALLSLLRSNRLPSTALRFSKQELADEAQYYGLDHRLRSAASPPPLSGIDASLVSTVRPASDALTTALSASAADGSLWIAHAGQLSSFDYNLLHSATVRTHLEEISALARLRRDSEIAALGSDSAAGLHFYDLSGGRNLGSVHWRDASDPRIFKARVASISDSPESDSVFAAFQCPHKENAVLAVDKSTLQTQSEIGRQSGSSAKNLVPGKLTWLPERGILFGASITCGAFGFSGYVRLWDPRSDGVVWETNEPGSGRSGRFGDPFADVAVDVDGSVIFKVCSKSGDLGMADIRKLGDDPWVYLKEQNPSLSITEGVFSYAVIKCYKKQAFVARDGGLEVWSSVYGDVGSNGSEGLSYRRNFVDKAEDCERGVIERIEGGGERLFVCRRDCEGVEVWESSNSSSVVRLV